MDRIKTLEQNLLFIIGGIFVLLLGMTILFIMHDNDLQESKRRIEKLEWQHENRHCHE